MSNKAHLHPHQKKRHASWITSLLVVILFIAIFALAVALAASGRGAPFSNLRLLRPDPETNWRQSYLFSARDNALRVNPVRR